MRSILFSCFVGVFVILIIPVARHYVEGATTGVQHTAIAHRSPQFSATSVFASGHIEGGFREVSLCFEPRGRIRDVCVEVGQTVRSGDVLARLDDDILQSELAEAQANLLLAKAQQSRLINGARTESLNIAKAEVAIADVEVRQADRHLKRTSTLIKRMAIPEQELDDRRGAHELAQAKLATATAKMTELAADAREEDVDIASAQVALAEARVRRAEKAVELCVLRAPRDGKISNIACEKGEVVGGTSSSSIIQLVDLAPVRVRAYVEELDAGRLDTGMTAKITVTGGGIEYSGRVTSCSPVMSAKVNLTNGMNERRDIRVREILVTLDADTSPQRLVIGLPVDVVFADIQ